MFFHVNFLLPEKKGNLTLAVSIAQTMEHCVRTRAQAASGLTRFASDHPANRFTYATTRSARDLHSTRTNDCFLLASSGAPVPIPWRHLRACDLLQHLLVANVGRGFEVMVERSISRAIIALSRDGRSGNTWGRGAAIH